MAVTDEIPTPPSQFPFFNVIVVLQDADDNVIGDGESLGGTYNFNVSFPNFNGISEVVHPTSAPWTGVLSGIVSGIEGADYSMFTSDGPTPVTVKSVNIIQYDGYTTDVTPL